MVLQQSLSILLIEDEGDAGEIIRSMLTMTYPQASIYTATDGLALFNTHEDRHHRH